MGEGTDCVGWLQSLCLQSPREQAKSSFSRASVNPTYCFALRQRRPPETRDEGLILMETTARTQTNFPPLEFWTPVPARMLTTHRRERTKRPAIKNIHVPGGVGGVLRWFLKLVFRSLPDRGNAASIDRAT
jgi:hypothetical protein